MKRGVFITLEGIEGAGKSTAINFVVERLRLRNIDFILTREPGGTEIAEEIRKVILNHYVEMMHPNTETLLYFAGRVQHLHSVIIPALNQGKWVLCDRFTDTTYAYQGGGRGLHQSKIAILENWVQEGLKPDRTFLFDLPAEMGLARIKRERNLDRIEKESLAFFKRIRNCYLRMAAGDPARFSIVDAQLDLVSIAECIRALLDEAINSWSN